MISFIDYEDDNKIEFQKFLDEQLTLPVLKAMFNIIIEEIFNIPSKKGGKKFGNNDFEDSYKLICKEIMKYLKIEFENILPELEKDIFFEELIEKNSFFSELNFDSENITIKEDFEYSINIVRNSANPVVCLPDIDIVDFMMSMKADNRHFAEFGDIEDLTEDDFWRLENVLGNLCMNSQSYHYFVIEDIKVFKNTAVRVYNKLYGKGHKAYEGRLNVQASETHRVFTEYLLYLSWAIQFKLSICEKSPNGDI